MAWQLVLQLAGQLAQQLVASGVTEQIVDLLEPIQPQQQQMAEAPFGGAAECFRQQPLQLAAVEQTCQGVMGRQALQAFFQGAALAEVDHDAFDEILMRAQVQ